MKPWVIGVFDGVHLGHRSLFNALQRQVEAITFINHPLEVLRPESAPLLITPPRLKMALLEEAGISTVHPLFFTKELADLSYEEFFALYPIQELIVGEDAAFGRNRLGTIEALQKLGKFKLHVIQKQKDAKQQVFSSSHIRSLIAKGALLDAEQCLGRPHCFLAESPSLLPPDGRYPVWIHSQRKVFASTLTIQGGKPLESFDPSELISFGENLNPLIYEILCQQTSLAAL